MTAQKKIGKRIKQLRELKKLTQEQFEEVSGINARYLSALELGQKNVTIQVLEKVSKALDIELIDLFYFESKDSRAPDVDLNSVFKTVSPEEKKKILKVLQILIT